ncbi:transcriptional regulator, XRE-family [hydrothermal vent metagenome]|uniref:Transcriptional regulator, XRE-family n=1 Tax=hydrothermal vent metagenome TaxID=652676 RepID=A0A1W1DY85_9ZZZZ
MREHIDEQIIKHNGVPVFVVVPYEAYQALKKQKSGDWWGDDTPHEVVGSVEIDGLSPIKAWRLFLKLTQQQVADRIGMQQSAYARIENNKALPKQSTLINIAQGLGVSLEQLS